MILRFVKKIPLFLLALVVASSMVLSNFSSSTSAVNCDYNFYNDNDFGEWYDPCDVVCGGSEGDVTVLRGDDNMEKIWNWLVGTGLSHEQTAGVMGNMQAESGFNPFRFQDGATSAGMFTYDGNIKGYARHAWGLVQWDGPRRIDQSGKRGVLGKLRADNPEYVKYIDTKYGAGANGYKNAPEDINDVFILFELNYMIAEMSPGGNRSTVLADLMKTDTVLAATVLFHNEFEGSSDSAETVKNGRGALSQAIFDKLDGNTASASENCLTKPDGKIVYYSQHDPKWGGKIYAHTTTISVGGCGPSSMAMILASLVDKNITPPDVAAVAGQQYSGTSSHGNLIAGVKAKWSVTITPMSLDQSIDFLKNKKGYVWVGGSGDRDSTPFTPGGHMVALVGVTSSGKITVADPHNPPHKQISDWDKGIISRTAGSYYGVSK